MDELNELISSHRTRADTATQALSELKAEVELLKINFSKAARSLDFSNLQVNIEYKSFGRENVKRLSKLICLYLSRKPPQINSNRIFQCVRNCFLDWERGWNDNPTNYYWDMRMLLGICTSCNWFTQKQHSNFEKWLKQLAGAAS